MPVASVSQISSLAIKPTDKKAAKIGSEWSEKIKAQSLFSARTTEQSYLEDIKKSLLAVAGRDITPQQAQIRLRATLGKLGYTSQHGFPNAPDVAVGAKGGVTDLSSTVRLRLIMDTNIKQARSMSQIASSEDPIFRMANPAWRLTRVGMRQKPRPDWVERWKAAGDAVGWKGALNSPKDFVALKDSPIWEALGNGAGGFDDTLKSAYPPFAFGSGMGWVNVGRRECASLGLDIAAATPTKAELDAYKQKLDAGFDPTRDLGRDLPFRFNDVAQLKAAEEEARRRAEDTEKNTFKPSMEKFRKAKNNIYTQTLKMKNLYAEIEKEFNAMMDEKVKIDLDHQVYLDDGFDLKDTYDYAEEKFDAVKLIAQDTNLIIETRKNKLDALIGGKIKTPTTEAEQQVIDKLAEDALATSKQYFADLKVKRAAMKKAAGEFKMAAGMYHSDIDKQKVEKCEKARIEAEKIIAVCAKKMADAVAKHGGITWS